MVDDWTADRIGDDLLAKALNAWTEETDICGTQSGERPTLLGTEWHLYRFGGPDGQAPLVSDGPRDGPITIGFQRNMGRSGSNRRASSSNRSERIAVDHPPIMDGEASGWAGCNNYWGQFEKRAFGLNIEGIATTLMACPEEQLDQERRYLQALEQADTYRIVGRYLLLYNSEGQPLLTCRAAWCERVACPPPDPTESEGRAPIDLYQLKVEGRPTWRGGDPMKKSRFSEEQMVQILSKGDKGEKTVAQICREHGISEATYYNWRKRFRGMVE